MLQVRRSDISYKLGWESVEKRKIVTGNESKTSQLNDLTSITSLVLHFHFNFTTRSESCP